MELYYFTSFQSRQARGRFGLCDLNLRIFNDYVCTIIIMSVLRFCSIIEWPFMDYLLNYNIKFLTALLFLLSKIIFDK